MAVSMYRKSQDAVKSLLIYPNQTGTTSNYSYNVPIKLEEVRAWLSCPGRTGTQSNKICHVPVKAVRSEVVFSRFQCNWYSEKSFLP